MPARYFPVQPSPLRMQAGLFRLGTDFGNGTLDASYFQFDERAEATLAEKGRVLSRADSAAAVLARSRVENDAHEAVLAWLGDTLRTEAPARFASLPASDLSAAERYEFFARRIQEDFVVLQRDERGADRAIAVYVCFPSSWRPERILGASFLEIHAPVPEFELVNRAQTALVSAMIERGPYVRFVWTLSADGALDHHPDHGLRLSFADPGARGQLRVERQLTVPFVERSASLFLIRTYLYPFESLEPEERDALASAVRAMPPALLRYKGLSGSESRILELLEQASHAAPRTRR